MQRLEVNGAVRPIYGSLGVKRLIQISLFTEQVKISSVRYTFIVLLCRGSENKDILI